jgi:hypothetical protein
VHEFGLAAAVELGRSASVADGSVAGWLEYAGGASDLAVKVARVKWGTPDDLVDAPELRDRELAGAERGGERGVLEQARSTASVRMR